VEEEGRNERQNNQRMKTREMPSSAPVKFSLRHPPPHSPASVSRPGSGAVPFIKKRAA